jgi:protein phosphatase
MTDAQPKRTQGGGSPREPEPVAPRQGAAADEAGERNLPPRAPDIDDEDRETLVPDAKKRASMHAVVAHGQITVRVVGRTDVGLVREHNEDNFLLADLATGSRDPATFQNVPSAGLVLGVCDGMGGAAAGEVASQMAVDTILEMMSHSVPAADRDALARALVRSIEEAGERIFDAARTDRSRRGMGTTATIAALMDKTLFVGQVGDSRAYILRAGELKQVTKDQSLVNQLIEAGQLTEDEAEAFEHSNIILQALGTTEQVSVDLTFLELRRGDRLLMCSDGLSGLVHGEVIREVMTECVDLDACSERLIELAKAGGGHDNVTVILAEFNGEGLAEVQQGDLAGYQQYPLPLDNERAQSALTSDVPTVAPPSSGRPASVRAGPESGSDLETRAGRPARLLLFALLASLLSAGIYLFTCAQREQIGQEEAPPPDVKVMPAPAPSAPRVEVVVRTDVEAGELLVDGESHGPASEGRWVLSLPAGPHKLEARASGTTVTSSLVTVREGVPATVLLSMPEGEDPLPADASSQTSDELKKDNAESRAELRRERRRHERAEHREEKSPEPGASAATPAAKPSTGASPATSTTKPGADASLSPAPAGSKPSAAPASSLPAGSKPSAVPASSSPVGSKPSAPASSATVGAKPNGTPSSAPAGAKPGAAGPATAPPAAKPGVDASALAP